MEDFGAVAVVVEQFPDCLRTSSSWLSLPNVRFNSVNSRTAQTITKTELDT